LILKGSYGINGYCVDIQAGREPRRDSSWYWRGQNVAGAAYVPLFLGAQRYNGVVDSVDPPPAYDGQGWAEGGEGRMLRFCLNRHDGFVNGLLTIRYQWPVDDSGGYQASDWPEWMWKFKDY